MKRSLILFILFCCELPAANCQPAGYWQQQVNYTIDVTLHDADRTLDGYVKMDYTNHSPDTLRFIWIHCWMNAFKNDRTAFTDQQLENGSTAYYFSKNDNRGYMNRLDFKANGATAKTEDHPLHQEIIRLLLPQPLAPGATVKIETPFHVKLPYAWSRGGYSGSAFWITQWYPKPAVYDRKGWHPMPYLDNGEYFAEFGNYDVQITLPGNYMVAATGNLQDAAEKEWLDHFKPKAVQQATKPNKPSQKDKSLPSTPVAEKTLRFKQDNVHDFAWFTDKSYQVKHETLQLPSGKNIDVYAFHYAKNETEWKNSIAQIKRAIITKSKWIGEYPFQVMSVVDGGNGGGMEYPTITLLESGGSEKMLDFVINHEVGHNWFQGILGSNERMHPWMDEGMNTYYDSRYSMQQYGNTSLDIVQLKMPFIKKRLPENIQQKLLQTVINVKKDQPIETSSEKFSPFNYNMVSYVKSGEWMKKLETELGTTLFDRAMQEYYRQWKFKHPYPEDFKKVMESVSGKDLSGIFSLLNRKGEINQKKAGKGLRFASFFSARATDKYNYIFASPAVGYNFYDKFMLGALFHNYTLPLPRFRFVLVPYYATGSKQFNGIGRISYNWYPGSKGQHAEVSVSGATFTNDSFTDSAQVKHYQRFIKVVPSVRFTFANKNPRSQVTKYLQWKTFLFREQGLNFFRDTVQQKDIITFPYTSRYLNQLEFVLENNRVLYPYKGVLQAQQGDGFIRLNFTGNYYFNYAKGGGMNVRLFAGKFIYTGSQTLVKKFGTERYHLNLTGPRGYEDYTYSNYFTGRNEFDGYSSQQMMIRDGGFKVGTDLLSNKVGKTDDWLAAMNFTTDIPKAVNPFSILPFKLPVKLFLDIGTFPDAWKRNAETGRFVYDAGVQLSLFNNIVNVYLPLLYSSVYKNYYKSVFTKNSFAKKIAFSIDLQNFNLKKIIPQLPF